MALTLRTTKKFDKCLETLKNRLAIGTGSGVIAFVVENYADTVDELRETRKELVAKTNQLERIIDINRRKKAIENEISYFFEEFNIKK